MRKVLFVGSINVKTGGPAMSTSLAMEGLRSLNVDARILMNSKDMGCTLRSNNIPVIWSPKPYNEKTGYPWKINDKNPFIEECEIIHPQGVWDYSVVAAHKMAKKMNKPYIVSLRGMLYPQALKKSAFKKKIFMKFVTSKVLSNAACIHATCEDEMTYYRDLGFKNPVAIIPNPIDISPNDENADKTFDCKTFRIGYLGRLHRRKNVEGLIKALSKLNTKYDNLELIIIGGGDDIYEQELKTLANSLNVNNIRFCGFVSGKEKEETLSSLSLLVMPSEFENFGNVILEGLAKHIPCVATKGSPWKVLEDYNCGWWVNFDQEEINNTIEKAINCSPEELKKMGNNGYRLLKEKFSKEIVGKQLQETYDWILGKVEKPDFVHIDKTNSNRLSL